MIGEFITGNFVVIEEVEIFVVILPAASVKVLAGTMPTLLPGSSSRTATRLYQGHASKHYC
jgi:hypothetical protein